VDVANPGKSELQLSDEKQSVGTVQAFRSRPEVHGGKSGELVLARDYNRAVVISFGPIVAGASKIIYVIFR